MRGINLCLTLRWRKMYEKELRNLDVFSSLKNFSYLKRQSFCPDTNRFAIFGNDFFSDRLFFRRQIFDFLFVTKNVMTRFFPLSLRSPASPLGKLMLC